MKATLENFKPRNWWQFALGMVCLLAGIWNLVLVGTWFNQVAMVGALFMAGYSVAMSITMPWIERLNKELSGVDHKAMGKAAAESFRAEIMDMQARGDLPPELVIEFGDKPPQSKRLN